MYFNTTELHAPSMSPHREPGHAAEVATASSHGSCSGLRKQAAVLSNNATPLCGLCILDM